MIEICQFLSKIHLDFIDSFIFSCVHSISVHRILNREHSVAVVVGNIVGFCQLGCGCNILYGMYVAALMITTFTSTLDPDS